MANKGGSKGQSNQRAIVKNPNNPAYKADADNRSQQMDPQNTKVRGDQVVVEKKQPSSG